MLDSKKKNRVKTITFFGLLLVILTGLSVALSGYAGKYSELVKDRNRALTGLGEEPDHTIDLLVIGDSECYTTVSPMDLWKDHGISAYLGGQSGQKIQESYYMLKTALETQKPKLVMMETNVLYRSADKPDALQDILYEAGQHYFPVFRYHDMWKTLLPGTKAGETDYKGYVPRTNVQPYTGNRSYMARTEEAVPVRGKTVRYYMDEILRICREEGIAFMLYSGPSPVNYNYKKHNGLAAYAKEQKIPYLDLNLKQKELGIDWQMDTVDKGDHLNLTGARKVTRYLGNYLKENYELPDHREEQSYREWNAEADRFFTAIGQTKEIKDLPATDPDR